MDIVEIGTLPPPGTVPEYMYAQVIRQQRLGNPLTAFEIEKIKIPDVKDDEVLVAVMAAGLNYNSVWAANGYPMDTIQLMQLRNNSSLDFQIAGSDCSGIVYKTGSKVTKVAVGDEVIIAPGWYEPEDPWVKSGEDVEAAPSARAWGYEINWGSFAQFCVAKGFQCFAKPKHLSWEQAAVYMLSGATAYRMLFGHPPHVVKKGDVVLIWGGAGGLGSIAIQMVLMAKGIPVAVVNSNERRKFCEEMGAKVVDRSELDHWGALTPEFMQPEKQYVWKEKAKKFMKKITAVTGGKLPRIVLEHPGEATMPTSLFICDRDGMVITCAGTSGYLGTFDIRYLWLQKKRIQGSHFAGHYECEKVNELITDKKLWPVLSSVASFQQLPYALQQIQDNQHTGNTAVKIGCS